MGVFEKLPYLNYHDINLDWLVRQTKKNASDNTYLMKIFKWFQDNGLVGVVTEITENPDDTVKIEYTETETQTTDDFTVYDKNGVDGLVSGLSNDISGLDNRLDTAEGDITNLQGDVSGLDGRLDTAENDIDNAQADITNIMTGLNLNADGTPKLPDTLVTLGGKIWIDTGGWSSSSAGLKITFTNTSRIIVFVHGSNAARMAIYYIYGTSSGNPVVADILTGSQISYTLGSGTITIANSSTTSCSGYILCLANASYERVTWEIA